MARRIGGKGKKRVLYAGKPTKRFAAELRRLKELEDSGRWPMLSTPKRPEKRHLPVTLDTGWNDGVPIECEPPLSAEAVLRLNAYRQRLKDEEKRGKGGQRNGP